jgi:stage II sporulation SpoE-like protein
VAVGLVSAAFSALRRKHDPLLLYLALFAVLYGIRLWIQAELLDISIHGSWFYPRLRSGINYIVPIPAILFFNAAGLLSGAGKIAGNILIITSSLLAAATFLLGPAAMYDRANSVMVIAAMIALVAQSTRSEAASADFAIIRRGLLIFSAFVVWDNLRGVLRFSLPSLEPFGFVAFLGSLGYVAAGRTLRRDQQLSEIQKNAVLCGNTQNQFVTAAYVHLDSVAHEMRYSAAGHPPMLLLRRGQITEVEANGLMLAAFDFATYSNATRRLEQGDRLLLYTDGILEAANAAGDFFGHDALCEVFRKTEATTPSDAADLIVSTVQKWSAAQDDDLTVLVCDYVGNAC